MIASLKLYGHIVLPCVPQHKPSHIPWSMGVKLKPLEVQLPSLWVTIHEEIINDEQIRLRFQELDALEEGRLQAVQNLELYHQNMVRVYDKLVKQCVFRKGELVLILRCPIVITHKTRGKFEPKWEWPFIIEQVYDGGAYQLVDHQGLRSMPPVNGRYLKKYFA
jgi:hypothetical protein